MHYPVKTPWLARMIWPSRLWRVDTEQKELFLTFDDGPHPIATPFVLDTLQRFQAKATFFCIGKNVEAYPDIYRRILDEGHQVGNHTQNHLNGWKTADDVYLKDAAEAARHIDSPLFRPPYGRIRNFQARQIKHAIQRTNTRIVMWSILSGDFDITLTKEKCLDNVIRNSSAGDIVVFHDSEKAFQLLEYSLPRTLEYFGERGFVFKRLTAP